MKVDGSYTWGGGAEERGGCIVFHVVVTFPASKPG